jgi:hypothetical protein
MLRKLIFSLFLGGLISMLAQAQTSTMDKSKACYGSFEFTIHQGPSAPLMLLGQVKLTVGDDGEITGLLSGNKGKALVVRGKLNVPSNSIEVVGQATGRSVSLVLKLPNGKHVFGTGASEYPLVACQGAIQGELGGVAAGPQSGDRGDWLTRCRKYKDPDRGCD